MRRQTDSGRLHEDTGDKTGPEIMVAPDSEAPSNPRIAAAQESPSAAEARHSADLYIRTSWVDAALALSELEKVQCSLYSTQSFGVKLQLSYCTCDCFSANVNCGTRQRGRVVAPTSGHRVYYQGRPHFGGFYASKRH